MWNCFTNSKRYYDMIYANLELLIKKIDNCKNNPEKSSTIKIGEHIPCSHWRYCWRFYENVLYFSKKTSADAVNFEKRKMLPLAEKETKSQRDVSFVEINSHKKVLKIKITETLQTIVILLVYTEIQHIIFVT